MGVSTGAGTAQTGQIQGVVMPVRGLVFDLDGTLVNTAPDLLAATNHVLALDGLAPLQAAQMNNFVGHGAKALLTRGFTARGCTLSGAALESRYRTFLDFYMNNIAAAGSAPYPGVVALIERAKAHGLGLAVCTNKLEALSVRLLDELDLSRHFGAVIGPDTIGVAKPDAAPFREAARRLNVATAEALMLGDSETDVLTARAAGVPIIAVPFGFTPEPVETYGPDHLVQHFDEVWPLLERHYL
jgi:phosphoglycolate phosphatase